MTRDDECSPPFDSTSTSCSILYLPPSLSIHLSMRRRGTMFTPCCIKPLVNEASASSKAMCNSKRPVVRLIGSDGKVKTYDKSVSAVEVTREFPSHLVCHSDAFCIGRKVPALREEEKLKPGHSYFLLPVHFFQSVLSFVTVASSLAKANGDALTKVFDIRRTPEGLLQVRINDEFAEKMAEEEREDDRKPTTQSLVCTTEELEKDYKQLVRCKSELWKPKLETIREKGRRLEAFESLKGNKKEKDGVILHPPPPSSSSPLFLFVKSRSKDKDRRDEKGANTATS